MDFIRTDFQNEPRRIGEVLREPFEQTNAGGNHKETLRNSS